MKQILVAAMFAGLMLIVLSAMIPGTPANDLPHQVASSLRALLTGS